MYLPVHIRRRGCSSNDHNLPGRRQPFNSTVQLPYTLPEPDKSTAWQPACRFIESESPLERNNAMHLKELWPGALVTLR